MSALQNLTASINGLTASTDRVVEAWHQPNATEAQIQEAANAVDNQRARLEALLAPAPEPTPAA